MADENRTADHPLIGALLKKGSRYSFFQAVSLLQKAYPDDPGVGRQGPVQRERIRFRPVLDMGFAPSDISEIRASTRLDGEVRYEVATTFLSLYGAVSPLPVYFTEQLMDQDEESLQKGFLDLFHHRLLALFYRTWEKYRYAIQFDGEGGDFFSRRLLSLLSVDPQQLPKTHHIPPVRLLAFAGMLTQIPRSAASLEGTLSDYFAGAPCHVEPCVDRWLPIPPDQRNRLAVENCRLGGDLLLGDRVFDRSSTFRVSMGPLGLDDFMSFLPPGDKMPEMRELVDLFNGDVLDYEVELNLKEDEIPPLQLSGPKARLGWSSWLGRKEGSDSRVRFLVKGWLHGRG